MTDDKIRISWTDMEDAHVDEELHRQTTFANAASPSPPWTNKPIASYSSPAPPMTSPSKQSLFWFIGGSVLLLVGAGLVFVAIHFREDAVPAESMPRQSNVARLIEVVLQQDVVASAGATSVAHIVTRMRAVDLAGCPNDFKSAYLTHIHAWERLAGVERQVAAHKADSESGAALAESFIRGLLGDPFGRALDDFAAETELQRLGQAAAQQIRDTYHRVEELAVSQGANLPKHHP